MADVTLTLAAVDPCYSCTERLAVVDSQNKVIFDYDALLKLSREKTSRIKKELGAPEFKLEALELLRNSGKSAGQVERELGITPGLLVKWRAKYQAVEKRGEGGEIDLELTDLEAAKREVARLKKAVMELEEEREILKKALGIFSRRNG